jgi:phage tail sheath protein FI
MFCDLQILSKDSVTVAVDAVVYFRISNATISVTNVEDAARSTKLLAQTTLRNILGTKTLAEMLSDREAISLQMQVRHSSCITDLTALRAAHYNYCHFSVSAIMKLKYEYWVCSY